LFARFPVDILHRSKNLRETPVHTSPVSILVLVSVLLTLPAIAEKKKKAADAKPKAKVSGSITFTPSGTAKEISQAQARFAEPMVALGDPRAPSPFTVDCSAPGSGRWIDPKLWVYDFKGKLAGGNRCTFTPVAGLKTLAGTPLSAGEPFRFDSGGPNVERTEPWNRSESVDEEQIFLVLLDGPVNRASVLAHAHFTVSGVEERVPVELLGEKETAELAKRELYATAERVVAPSPSSGVKVSRVPRGSRRTPIKCSPTARAGRFAWK
jgi:hypothetical protein